MNWLWIRQALFPVMIQNMQNTGKEDKREKQTFFGPVISE